MAKKFITILVVIAVLGAGAYVLYLQRSSVLKTSQNRIENTQEDQSGENFTVEDKKITDGTKPFKIDITYPYVAGLDKFNQKIKDILDARLAQFKKNSLENDEAVKKIDPESYAQFPREYDFTAVYNKGEIDENTASVVLEIYTFEGGAHGATNFVAINYNPKTDKEIKLSDLFAGQKDYVQKISAFTGNDLKKQITQKNGTTEGTWINEGASAEEENFSTFLINKDSVTFYFSPYQVAPYALGDFKVTMPK